MSKFLTKLYIKGLLAKESVKKTLTEERGEANIIAIILILAIVIALAIVFRTQLSSLFNKIWASLFANVDNVI